MMILHNIWSFHTCKWFLLLTATKSYQRVGSPLAETPKTDKFHWMSACVPTIPTFLKSLQPQLPHHQDLLTYPSWKKPHLCHGRWSTATRWGYRWRRCELTWPWSSTIQGDQQILAVFKTNSGRTWIKKCDRPVGSVNKKTSFFVVPLIFHVLISKSNWIYEISMNIWTCV